MGIILSDDRKADQKMKRIEEYINTKFAQYSGYEEVEEIRNDILLNCSERYNDCIRAGMSGKEAEDSVIASVGDLDALLKTVVADNGGYRPEVIQNKEQSSSDDYEGEIHTIDVSTLAFDVVLTTSNTDEIVVEAPEGIRQNESDGILHIEEFHERRGLFISIDGTVKISVPYDFDTVNIRTKSGDVDLKGIEARHLRVNTMSGDIEGKVISPDAVLRSLSGDIEMVMQGNHGKVNAGSTSGDVEMELDGYDVMELSSTSGDVEVTPYRDFKECRINVISGDITVNADHLSGVDARMRSVSGDCICRAASASGCNSVEARTVSGDVRIR